MKTINVTISGITPLLLNRFIPAQIEGKSKKKPGAEKDQNIENKLYRDGNEKIYVPSVYIERCLIDAGKNFQIRGKRKSTYSKLAGSHITIMPLGMNITPQVFEEFSTSAVNPMTKGRMLVIRPMFKKWGISFTIEVDEAVIPIEVIKEMLDYAGMYVGIGDWRPEKKGKYGKFMVTTFKTM